MAKIDSFLREMVKLGGSDLHLCSEMAPKTRIHGDLTPLPFPPIPAAEMLGIMEEIATHEKWSWFLENKDQDFAYEIPGLARFRVNFMYNHFGPGAVLRIIPTNIKAERDVREQDVAPADTAARRPQLSAPRLSRTLQWLRESSNALLCVLNLFVGIPLGSIIAMTLLASGFCCQRQGYSRAAKWLNSLCFVINVLSITVSVITFMNSN